MADIKVGMIFDVPKARESARTAATAAQEAINETMKKAESARRNIFGGIRPDPSGVPAHLWFARNPGQTPAQVRAAAGAAGAAGGGGSGGIVSNLVGGLGEFGKSLFKVVSIIEILRRTIQAINNTMDEARRRYVKQLQTGMPGGFTTFRSSLADVLGVSENEVLRYGKAVQWMTDRVKLSYKELDRTTKVLATAAVHWRILGLNFRAVWATIVAELAPTLSRIAMATAAWVEFIRESGWAAGVAKTLAVALQLLATTFMAIQVPLYTVAAYVITFADSLEYLYGKLKKMMLFGPLSAAMPDDTSMFKESKAAWSALGKLISSMFHRNTNQLPNATSDYRRLDASPWERMGLVIGGGMANTPIKNIERHTRRTAELLGRIVLPRNNQTMVHAPKMIPNAL